jgi:hypothetical protein
MIRLNVLAALAASAALVACSSTEREPSTGAAIGTSLGVPIVVEEPPPPNSARVAPQGGLLAPTPPPFGAPRGAERPSATPTYERTRTSERVTVGGDGAVRTERTTTTVGFNPDRAAGALERVTSGALSGGVAGTWQMQSSSSGVICTVYLYGAPADRSGGASSAGCPAGGVMSGVSSWSYDNGRLTLTKGGTTAMVISQQGPNRFDGTATWGFLSTRIALYR